MHGDIALTVGQCIAQGLGEYADTDAIHRGLRLLRGIAGGVDEVQLGTVDVLGGGLGTEVVTDSAGLGARKRACPGSDQEGTGHEASPSWVVDFRTAVTSAAVRSLVSLPGLPG